VSRTVPRSRGVNALCGVGDGRDRRCGHLVDVFEVVDGRILSADPANVRVLLRLCIDHGLVEIEPEDVLVAQSHRRRLSRIPVVWAKQYVRVPMRRADP
jgi:hypothetical protein